MIEVSKQEYVKYALLFTKLRGFLMKKIILGEIMYKS